MFTFFFSETGNLFTAGRGNCATSLAGRKKMINFILKFYLYIRVEDTRENRK